MARISGTKNINPNQNNNKQTIGAPGGNVDIIIGGGGTGQGQGQLYIGALIPGDSKNVGNPFGIPYDPLDIWGDEYEDPSKSAAERRDLANNRRKEGSVFIPGGVGIQKDLNVGGWIYGRITEANTSQRLIVSATNLDQAYYLTFVEELSDSPVTGRYLYGDETGDYTTYPGLRYNPNTGLLMFDKGRVADELNASGSWPTIDAPFEVKGGAAIAKDTYIGNDLFVGGNQTSGTIVSGDHLPTVDRLFVIGTEDYRWQEAWLEKVYTKVLTNTSTDITIAPKTNFPGQGVTEIQGDIRVLGQNPIGTAPVVTNTLYVTMDGNDTNDGRAQDPSRACRTVTGATRSPYFQPGTQIRVAAGHYLEDNPIRMKPYTSVMGSDIRTTSLEPINKTQDLFHLDSGCYLAFMQFCNGRSGLLPGPYEDQYNRGAYCTAFPPLPEGEKIDVYHSPYIQNCTNLSGPWLRDGTWFVPNQTVQVPVAVGTGTWAKGVTTITVQVSSGTIVAGMSINPGNQNPGFWNARTLLLANKPFLQEQVVAFINENVAANIGNPSSIWYDFTYNQEKCKRDVGILVENVAYDASFGGNEKAVQSGLAYYDGVVSLIAGQELQTTEAILYLNSLTNEVVTNTVSYDFLSGTGTAQVINTVLTGGEISTASYDALFFTITNIINNGPDVAPEVYTSPGPDAAFVSAEILIQANRAFIQEDTINYINYELLPAMYPGYFSFSERKCRRDTGLIIDSMAFDMKFPTAGWSQSTFAGNQYWKLDTTVIPGEINTTTSAIGYLKETAVKIIKNITTADDLVERYQTFTTQDTSTYQAATAAEVAIIEARFDEIIDIIANGGAGWTDKIVSNSTSSSQLLAVQNAVDNLQLNKTYLAAEINAYVTATNVGFVYDDAKCYRDVGYMVDAVSFDLLYGGNRQSVQAGLYYYDVDPGTTAIYGETTATIDAFNYLRDITKDVVKNIPVTARQKKYRQDLTYPAADTTVDTFIDSAISTITNIIANGPSSVPGEPIAFTASGSTEVTKAFNIIYANKDFLKEEVIAYIDETYNPGAFNYNEEKCYRDIGLMLDAVSQDILLGGNQKSVEAGLSYWTNGYNVIAGEVTTTTMAIEYMKEKCLWIARNESTTTQANTLLTQVINPFFQYGEEYGPQEAIKRNFFIISNIIANGPDYAPIVHEGGGLQALTGINKLDTKESFLVTAVNPTGNPDEYIIGLNSATIGFGYNATLYFGSTAPFPKTDAEVEELSIEYTGNASTWNQRKVDPIGGMGGSLVDGAVVSDRSPIQSFVYDAFTQLTQGGRGVRITNNGYAQLVSVFTIFASTGVQVDNGGIASIVNSNANFGDICLLAKGFGRRKFSGTIYNPPFKAFNKTNGDRDPTLDAYYPYGFWPGDASVMVFTPDVDDRPHISLVMEIVPPEGHKNEQELPGFLNAIANTATLNTGSIVISDIDTDGIAIGNSVFVRDQYGFTYTGTNSTLYVDTGTVVVDIGYKSVTLNKALTNGASQPDNDNFFNVYFCGNAYYTVLNSVEAANPTGLNGINLLDPLITGGGDQRPAHIDAIRYIQTLTNAIIDNVSVPGPLQTTTTQVKNLLVTGGIQAQSFTDLRYQEIVDIFSAANVNDAEAVIPKNLRTKKGPAVQGAGSAIKLIEANIEFIADEVNEYVKVNYPALTYNDAKCQRDVKLILQRLIYDLQTGGRYNSVMTGLSYWSRQGTHHVVRLGENVRRTDLFPDGSTVNFYQRSYISASGYVFEYVGAGTNYGALPQVGRADPVQGKEVVQLGSGKVFFTSTDQNGDFRIGPGLVISQATGVLSGRTFQKSLYAYMTPLILAIEGAVL